jgi:hypothetical protein
VALETVPLIVCRLRVERDRHAVVVAVLGDLPSITDDRLPLGLLRRGE